MSLKTSILSNLTRFASVLFLGCFAWNPLSAQQATPGDVETTITQSNKTSAKQPESTTDGRKAKSSTSRPTKDSRTRIRFRPRSGDAPSARLTGGSRGKGNEQISLDVLTPEEIGLTTQEQPSLFWHQSKPADVEFELTLLQENKIEPLIHVNVKKSVKAGIQRLILAKHDVKLDMDVEYQWVVALITDPDSRSSDLVASGVIERIALSPELKAQINNAQPADLAATYAEAGIWYDSLAALTDQIDAHPHDADLVAARTDLLAQVGLKFDTNQ